MDDPRDLILNRVRQNRNGFIIDHKDRWNDYILSSIVDTIFYTIADYIRVERETHKSGMGELEIKCYCTDEVIHTDNARKYLEERRDKDDTNLIVFIYDNIYEMESGTHRRTLLYLINMLYFDL